MSDQKPTTPSRPFFSLETYGTLTYIIIANTPILCAAKNKTTVYTQLAVWGMLLLARQIGERLLRSFYTEETISTILTIFYFQVAFVLILSFSSPGLYVKKHYDFQADTSLCQDCKYFHKEEETILYCQQCKLCHYRPHNHCQFTGKCITPWNGFWLFGSISLMSILLYFWGYFYFCFMAQLMGFDLGASAVQFFHYVRGDEGTEFSYWEVLIVILKFQAFLAGISLFGISVISVQKICGVMGFERPENSQEQEIVFDVEGAERINKQEEVHGKKNN